MVVTEGNRQYPCLQDKERDPYSVGNEASLWVFKQEDGITGFML